MSLSTYEQRPQFADGTLLSLGGPERGAEPWYLLRHLPSDAQARPLDFDEIADCSPGSRKWLGYLRVDVDGAGRHFRRLEGDPLRTSALSRLLDLFFAKSANDLLAESRFKNIYAVYGGGDDLFVIGPWADSLEFARELRGLLRGTAGDDLTFSAGMALAKPREHILTQAERAHELLDDAKNGLSYGRKVGRDQVCALGTIADWQTFAGLIDTAKQVTQWVHDRELPSSLIHRVLELHEAWETGLKQRPKERLANPNRYRPLLHYQIQRNIKPGDAAEWSRSLLAPESQWPWADFIARYAMLAGKPDGREGG
jgi:CRISPR-associated protein Csm1